MKRMMNRASKSVIFLLALLMLLSLTACDKPAQSAPKRVSDAPGTPATTTVDLAAIAEDYLSGKRELTDQYRIDDPASGWIYLLEDHYWFRPASVYPKDEWDMPGIYTSLEEGSAPGVPTHGLAVARRCCGRQTTSIFTWLETTAVSMSTASTEG